MCVFRTSKRVEKLHVCSGSSSSKLHWTSKHIRRHSITSGVFFRCDQRSSRLTYKSDQQIRCGRYKADNGQNGDENQDDEHICSPKRCTSRISVRRSRRVRKNWVIVRPYRCSALYVRWRSSCCRCHTRSGPLRYPVVASSTVYQRGCVCKVSRECESFSAYVRQ